MRRASSTLVLGTIKSQKLKAHVVKLVNTLHSGCSELKLLEVRVFSWAQAIRLITGFFCFMTMRIAYLHTNPFHQAIEDLILDIISNNNSHEFHTYEIKYTGKDWYNISKFIEIRRFLKKNKIDIIHAYHYSDACYALIAALGLNIKVVFSCYSYYDNIKWLSRIILKKVLSKASAVIFQTETQKNRFYSRYKNNQSNFFKLFHGFSLDRLDNYKFNSIRDEYFIDDYRFLIGTLGDISPRHDVLNILKMVKKLRKSGRNFTCLISGGVQEKYDSYFDECKYYFLLQGLDNYITYVGNRTDYANYLSQLDVLVYHSDNEAVALPVIQAMLSGINVVVNDDEMIKEITHNGKYATLYKSKDATDFADNTRNILTNLEDYKIIAETIKEECRKIFSIEKHISGLKEIYKQIKNN